MIIKTFIQGENDKELFGLLGSIVLSKEVHKQLGTAITTADKDQWLLAFDKEDNLLGFATFRKIKSTKAIHIRFVYAFDCINKKKIVGKLIKNLMSYFEVYTVWTNARDDEEYWYELGFINKKGTRNTGKFVRFEKDLKDD